MKLSTASESRNQTGAVRRYAKTENALAGCCKRPLEKAQPLRGVVVLYGMRGQKPFTNAMFYAIDLEGRVQADHPLRPIKAAVDAILIELGPLLDRACSKTGRPSRLLSNPSNCSDHPGPVLFFDGAG